ncbi:Asp-tRNA(Asn)/Glu-tRNA(Gln) amidotransferase subunit GatC [Periweissella beninensis]|uniref:Aspartyl/glutamyl-tRNA(Asn/Gln) amidotransferase subunit C n=1 Tax=Periweissella beninensis TaxID=504936 RepID=A0ABT0VIE2_9LACO|nr:Asp-tRNA(Asn)/Glu-tRNA(Gln) amidotransferase subunit GatC [Periweissella beninensis]MBM7543694.1 aspartyl-tRNA(Asn)/glutamyl-tRNA(Gln) amidotransferase subunit C [Periweissella beninensis]MCM2436674.1 Asp-tRNA(Asn)/Glu-tRNA(Gln) amidotransferase subunit GatC [Periweissella beninensis]MCT4395643.1 Asp-tRNA(Asn)/Glu-tRNA(Gln) amidotransferase subunit GatC [Periweissella beninensis]
MAETELTQDDVKHVAQLAMLTFEEQKLEHFTTQLDDILNLVETLNEVDTTDVPATFTVTENVNVLRTDTANNTHQGSELLANAPEAENGLIKVPAIIDESEEA